MRALCGAVIAAGALIGLGLASLGVGTRYAMYQFKDLKGNTQWVQFSDMDVSLIMIIVLLIGGLIVGLGIAILGLAYHHQRRHLEHLHRIGQLGQSENSPRVTVG